MHSSVTHKPTLAAELFGGGVGFRWERMLRRTSGALLIGTALLLAVRRAAGRLEESPSVGTAILAMGLAVAVAALYRWALSYDSAPGESVRGRIVSELGTWYLPTAALALIAFALSIHGIDLATLLVLWLVPAGSEAAWILTRRHNTAEAATIASLPATEALSPAPSESPLGDSESEPAAVDDPGVSQSWKRFVDAAGCDVFEGYVRALFEVGSRQASIHLAFCPPFERTPVVECEPVDDIDLRLVQAVVLPYAARIDVRLSEPAEEALRTTIAIRAVAKSSAVGDEAGV